MSIGLSRVAQVVTRRGDKVLKVASGFLVSLDRVLTVSHVLGHGESEVLVRLRSQSGAWETVGTSDLVVDQSSDVALIRIQKSLDLEPVRPGRMQREISETHRAEAVGFPIWKARFAEGRSFREVCSAIGSISVLSNQQEGHLDFVVENGPSGPLPDEESAWLGMSGAATLVGQLLVGWVGRTHEREGPTHLEVLSVEALYNKAGPVLESLIAHCGWPNSVLQVPVCLSVDRPSSGVPAYLLATHQYGRQHEIEALQEWLDGQNVEARSLVGAPGFGKSAIAARLAKNAELSGRQVSWLSLAGATDPHDLAAEVGGHSELGAHVKHESSGCSAGGIHRLVVLDGLNSDVIAAVAQAVLPGVKVLVTTNRSSCVLGEPLEIGPLDSDSSELFLAESSGAKGAAGLPGLAISARGWPLLIELLGRSVRRAITAGMSADSAVAHHLDCLSAESGPSVRGFADLIERTVALLLEDLSEQESEWAWALGGLLYPQSVSTELLECLWDTDELRVNACLVEISDLRICNVDWTANRIVIHESIYHCLRDHVRHRLESPYTTGFVERLLANRDRYAEYLAGAELAHLADLGRWRSVHDTIISRLAGASFGDDSVVDTLSRLRDVGLAADAAARIDSDAMVSISSMLGIFNRVLLAQLGSFVWTSLGVESILQLLATPGGREALGSGMDGASRMADLAARLHHLGRGDDASRVMMQVLGSLSEAITVDGIPDAVVGSSRTLLSANREWSTSFFEMADDWLTKIESEPVRVMAASILSGHLFVYSPTRAVAIAADIVDSVRFEPSEYSRRLSESDEFFDFSVVMEALAPVLAYKGAEYELILEEWNVSSSLVWLGRLARSEPSETAAVLRDIAAIAWTTDEDELLSQATDVLLAIGRPEHAIDAGSHIRAPGLRARTYSRLVLATDVASEFSVRGLDAALEALEMAARQPDWLDSAISVAYAQMMVSPGSEVALTAQIAARLSVGAPRSVLRKAAGQLAVLFPDDALTGASSPSERRAPASGRTELMGPLARFAARATAEALERGLTPADAFDWASVRNFNPWDVLVRWSDLLAGSTPRELTAADVVTLQEVARGSEEAFFASTLYARSLARAASQSPALVAELLETWLKEDLLIFKTTHSRPLAEVVALEAQPVATRRIAEKIQALVGHDDREAGQRGIRLVRAVDGGDYSAAAEILGTDRLRPIVYRSRSRVYGQALPDHVLWDDLELESVVFSRRDLPLVAVDAAEKSAARRTDEVNAPAVFDGSDEDFLKLVNAGMVRSRRSIDRLERSAGRPLAVGMAAISLTRWLPEDETVSLAVPIAGAVRDLGSAWLPYDALSRLASRRILSRELWAELVPALFDVMDEEYRLTRLSALNLGMWSSRIAFYSYSLGIEPDRTAALRATLGPPSSMLWDLAEYLGRSIRRGVVVEEFLRILKGLARLADRTGFSREALSDAARLLDLLPEGRNRIQHLRIAFRQWPGDTEDLLRIQSILVRDLFDVRTGALGYLDQIQVAAQLTGQT